MKPNNNSPSLKHRKWRRLFAIVLLCNLPAEADLAVREIRIAPAVPKSHVPEATRQGHFLNPQAISALDVTADGMVITAGTMAFSHDANVWQFSPDGAVLARRFFAPWAPMQ